MPATLIPDEVWFSIDPTAGRLSRGDRRRVIALCVGVAIFLAFAIAGAVIGVIAPRFTANVPDRGYAWQARPNDVGRHDVWLRVSLANGNYITKDVSRVTSGDPNLAITFSMPLGFAMPSYSSRTVELRVHVRDCGAVSRSTRMPLQLVTDHWWGYSTDSVTWDSGGGGPHGPTDVAWDACHGGDNA